MLGLLFCFSISARSCFPCFPWPLGNPNAVHRVSIFLLIFYYYYRVSKVSTTVTLHSRYAAKETKRDKYLGEKIPTLPIRKKTRALDLENCCQWVYIYVCVCVCVCIYIHTYIHTYIHICTHTHTHTHTMMCVCVCIHIGPAFRLRHYL